MEILVDTSDALISHPIGLAFVFVAVFYIVSTFISYQTLRHIPGPPLAGFSQLWLAYATSKGDLYRSLQQVIDQYGSPARIGPNMIVFDDPEIYRAAIAPRSPYKRGEWYKGMQLDPRIDNLLSERNEKRHTELRSKMLHAVSSPSLQCLD